MSWPVSTPIRHNPCGWVDPSGSSPLHRRQHTIFTRLHGWCRVEEAADSAHNCPNPIRLSPYFEPVECSPPTRQAASTLRPAQTRSRNRARMLSGNDLTMERSINQSVAPPQNFITSTVSRSSQRANTTGVGGASAIPESIVLSARCDLGRPV